MGHSTLGMTADRYGHLFPSNEEEEKALAAGERRWAPEPQRAVICHPAGAFQDSS
jgi:hypothetical protein